MIQIELTRAAFEATQHHLDYSIGSDAWGGFSTFIPMFKLDMMAGLPPKLTRCLRLKR